MAIHRVLIERDEDVDLVAHVAHGRVARANGEERVPAADDRLVGVIGVEVEPAPRKNARENIPGGGDALTVLAADPTAKSILVIFCHLEYWEVQSAGQSALRQIQTPPNWATSISCEIRLVPPYTQSSPPHHRNPPAHIPRQTPCPPPPPLASLAMSVIASRNGSPTYVLPPTAVLREPPTPPDPPTPYARPSQLRRRIPHPKPPPPPPPPTPPSPPYSKRNSI